MSNALVTLIQYKEFSIHNVYKKNCVPLLIWILVYTLEILLKIPEKIHNFISILPSLFEKKSYKYVRKLCKSNVQLSMAFIQIFLREDLFDIIVISVSIICVM